MTLEAFHITPGPTQLKLDNNSTTARKRRCVRDTTAVLWAGAQALRRYVPDLREKRWQFTVSKFQ